MSFFYDPSLKFIVIDGNFAYIFDNQHGSLYINNSDFSFNFVFAIFQVINFYEFSISNSLCNNNNNFETSGTCYLLENIFHRTFENITIFNDKSNGLCPGIIINDNENIFQIFNFSNEKLPKVFFFYF